MTKRHLFLFPMLAVVICSCTASEHSGREHYRVVSIDSVVFRDDSWIQVVRESSADTVNILTVTTAETAEVDSLLRIDVGCVYSLTLKPDARAILITHDGSRTLPHSLIHRNGKKLDLSGAGPHAAYSAEEFAGRYVPRINMIDCTDAS